MQSLRPMDTWELLDLCAKKTGTAWCEWPKDLSKSLKPCRTCVKYFTEHSYIQGETFTLSPKQAEHVASQKRIIASIRQKKSSKFEKRQPYGYGYTPTSHHSTSKSREKGSERPSYIGSIGWKSDTTGKSRGQYCHHHHMYYQEGRCECPRDREGFMKVYSTYDMSKWCGRCDSRCCDCFQTTEENVIKKIVVKEIYGSNPKEIEGIVTETLEGQTVHRYCTSHRDTDCDCGTDPSFYKIIKEVW